MVGAKGASFVVSKPFTDVLGNACTNNVLVLLVLREHRGFEVAL